MHFYSKKHNFYGGQGIVGAQIPIGAGLAFANKYLTPSDKDRMPIAIVFYGDGAANQGFHYFDYLLFVSFMLSPFSGQVWEAANMAKLWGLPLALVVENNHYGMGTSTKRHSCNDLYYTMGGRTIPGIKMNGMNVLSVKQGMSFVKDYCSSGK
jgi:pyruvate dehydrogenase E1 component alpha subunit